MLGNNNSVIYLNIAEGKIVLRRKEPTAISKERITKQGKTVHEEHYDSLEGIITDITTKDSDYGKFWVVMLVNQAGTRYNLQFPYSGGNAVSFLKSLPNADISKPICIRPRVQIINDKRRSSMVLIQDGQALRWKWTKDTPGDIPSLKQIKVKGIVQWDDSDMMDYLEHYLMTEIMPKLRGGATIGAADDDDEPAF